LVASLVRAEWLEPHMGTFINVVSNGPLGIAPTNFRSEDRAGVNLCGKMNLQPGVVVRKEWPADVEAIRALHTASFPTGAEAALVDALRVARRLEISLVSVEGDRVVGHVGFSPVTVDGEPLGLGLAPVAVWPDYRRRGVAAQLIREGLELCRKAAIGVIVVLGNPRYYSRFGFEPAGPYRLRDEYAGGDAFQVMELVRGSVPVGGGLVRYAPEFAALGA
jgi:putative acetyltransferase